MQTRDLHRPQKPGSPLATILQGGCFLLLLGVGYLAVRAQPAEGPRVVYELTPALRPTMSATGADAGLLGASIAPRGGSSPVDGGSDDDDDDDDAPDVDVLVGVITYPPNFERREMLRDFNAKLGVADGRVRVEYVVGDSYFAEPPSAAMQARMAAEAAEHRDVVSVSAREVAPPAATRRSE